MSKIVIKCPSCSKLNSVGSEHVNKHARCGSCQTVFLVRDDSDSNSPGRSLATTSAPNSPTAPAQPTAPNPGGYRPVPPATSYPTSAASPTGPAAHPFTPQPPSQLPQISTGVATFGGPHQGHASCPYCRTQSGVYSRSEISQAGWIVFAVMIVTCWPLFWIGLLIKEDKVHCAGCHARLS